MVLNELLRSTTICIQSNPEISALVVGGIRLLVDVGFVQASRHALFLANKYVLQIAVKYVTFFPKLTNMISQLSEYLAVLQSYVDRLDREPEKNAHLIQQVKLQTPPRLLVIDKGLVRCKSLWRLAGFLYRGSFSLCGQEGGPSTLGIHPNLSSSPMGPFRGSLGPNSGRLSAKPRSLTAFNPSDSIP